MEEKLAACGLRVKWTGKQAKAHGVGGQAVVKGIMAIPLGLAGTSGLLEATVVEGDIPLLLPVKLLRQLQSVIDLENSFIHFSSLQRSTQLHCLPSGHVAIDVLDFGAEGFRCPEQAAVDGYGDDDFRLTFCPSNSQGVMFTTPNTQCAFQVCNQSNDWPRNISTWLQPAPRGVHAQDPKVQDLTQVNVFTWA